jgi:hypothetical protein
MTIKELIELVDETKEVLIKDFKVANDREPSNKELLTHVRKIYKEGIEDNILGDIFLDDVDCPDDFYKLLMIFAANK